MTSQSASVIDMKEWMDIHPNVVVQESEYKRLLGYPGSHVLEGRARELVETTRQWYSANGGPWVYAQHIHGLETAGERVRVNGTQFTSKLLHDQFATAQVESAVLVVVSAGRACEDKARELWQEAKPDEYFFMEMYGSAVVEHLVTNAGARICDWAEQKGMAVLPHYSPGYSGWEVSDQFRLWELIIRERSQEFPEAIEVLESGMLRPKKSLLAVFGLTRNPEMLRRRVGMIPCENCSFSPCQYRRAPYRNSLPQIEDVRRLQSGEHHDLTRNGKKAVLEANAKYSINTRALQKWSRDRLQLKFCEDGCIEARFRYEGTTCSNMGRALEFEYFVKLGAAEQEHRIIGANCAPVPDDSGHRFMCEYLTNPEGLMKSIADEKPLVGRPLNDVLDWKRQANPSGCYCDIDRRIHKWGLVYEVIHFALAQHQKD
jgi:hypothetical protein